MSHYSWGESDDNISYKQFKNKRTIARKKKKRIALQSNRLTDISSQAQHEEVKETAQYSIWLKILQGVVNFLAVLFVITCGFGALLHFKRQFFNENDDEEPIIEPPMNDVEWSEAKEAAILAFTTSWKAFGLWGRLFIQYLIPTSHATFLITKGGFIAMQPSLRLTLEFLTKLPPMVKLAIGGTVSLFLLVLLIVEEARKRKFIEKIVDSYYNLEDSIAFKYRGILKRINQRSRFVGSFIPHILFIGITGTAQVLFPDSVSSFSRGVGGWMLVIGLPVVLSIASLVIYDQKYLNRIQNAMKMNRKKSKRRFSELPKFEEEEKPVREKGSIFGNFFSNEKKAEILKVKKKQEEEQYLSENEMRPYLTLTGRKKYKTMRGINPVEYPRLLDVNDRSSEEQAGELSNVIAWLKYWLMLGFALVLEQLPVSGHFLAIIPIWTTMRMFLALWLYLPFTNGAILAFDFSLPLIDRHWRKIQVLRPNTNTTDFSLVSKFVVDQLPISQKQKKYLTEIGETGSTLLFTAVPFFILPSFISAFGIVYLGLVRPMYQGYVTIYSFETAADAVILRNRMNDVSGGQSTVMRRNRVRLRTTEDGNLATVASTCLHCTTWLEYWVVYALAMFAIGLLSSVLNFMPFGNQLQLAVLLWLQLPYFRGARQVFKSLLKRYYRFKKRFFGKPKRQRTRVGRYPKGDEEVNARKLEDTTFVRLKDKEEKQESGFEKSLKEEETSAPPSPARSIKTE